MKLLFDSFWRAVLYCLHPRAMWLSFFPLILLVLFGGVLGYFFWSDAVESVRLWLEGSGIFSTILDWGTRLGMGRFRTMIPPLTVIALSTPVLILMVMLVVAWMMTPALLDLVSRRRFQGLAKTGGAPIWLRVIWSLGYTFFAMLFLLLSIPLWFVPPFIMILPPLIWGWLAYRVMSFDALAGHATKQEREAIMKEHRAPLFFIGIAAGYLGALPSFIWAAGAMAAVFAVMLMPIALWLYTLIFAFSSLWFIHYCLAALEEYRARIITTTTIDNTITHANT